MFQKVDKLIINEQQNDQNIAKTTGNPNAITPFSVANQAELNQMTRKFPTQIFKFNPFRVEGHLQRIQDHGREIHG